jgi:Flp pilus assembly pilin Flp
MRIMNNELTPTKSPTRSKRSLREDTRGAGLVEYIILVGVIALLALAGFRTFGSDVNTKAIDLGSRVRGI